MVSEVDYRREFFTDFINKAKEHGLEPKGKRVLTIGERMPDFKIIEASKQEWSITVIEASRKNIQNIMSNPYIRDTIGDSSKWKLICADIRNISSFENQLDLKSFDIVWWFHGIEHLEKEEGIKIFEFIKKNCKILMMSLPHGTHIQPSELVISNVYEEHKSEWLPEEFIKYTDAIYITGKENKGSIDLFIKGDLYE